MEFSSRRIIEAKLPEPGGESRWTAEGNRARNILTRWPANHNRISDSGARPHVRNDAVKIVRRDQFDEARPFEREFDGIRRYEPISRNHPSLVAILHVGGSDDCFYYVGKQEEARTQLRRMIDLDPGVPIGEQLLGCSYYAERNYMSLVC